MSIDRAYNFRAIDEMVSTAGLLSEGQFSELGENGYEAVINLLPHESQYSVTDEEQIVTGQGLEYLYIPVDFSHPTEANYSAFVQAIKACEGRKVLVHCAANYRVSAFYAMYAYEHCGWSASRAREHIASLWNPADSPPWRPFISRHIPENP